MADRTKPGADWLAKPLYWAVISYYRAWLATDGAHVAVVREAKGLDVPMLRRIGEEYRVSRWIPGAEKSAVEKEDYPGVDDDPSARMFCRILNDARAAWPLTGLVARSGVCIDIVQEARDRQVSGSNLVSATTKFMWFLKPAGWTVFDRFACVGMGIDPTKGDAATRMTRFYAALEAQRFEDLIAGMQEVIDQDPLLSGLPAGRIIDNLLMARGGWAGEAETFLRVLRCYPTVLPPPVGEALLSLATCMQATFGDHPLTSPDPKALS
ncbi:hypothetical protein [Falsiroseomonas sp.]|uniref:hypothetical protein n=1 Tax=Falsiroseomonas sp. TaxID=2870721 RepID=UPI003F6F190C